MSEEQDEELILHAAVMHILDFRTGASVYSEQVLDLEDETVFSYVMHQMVRAVNDMQNREGTFREDSSMKRILEQYAEGELDFLPFSLQAAQTAEEVMKTYLDLPADCLVLDYEQNGKRYAGILFLEISKAFTQITEQNERTVNTIFESYSVLPGFSKKIRSAAFVCLDDFSIRFLDEASKNADSSLMQEVLGCTSGKSSEEVLKTLTKITEQVAEEHEENPALMVSRVKNYLRQTTESSPSVTTEDLSSHVFSESEELKTAFEKRAEEEEIPEEVVLPKTAAVRKLKNQRIRTDTGIELTFPTEYFSSPDFIEFTNHPDGTISIELKHIGKITNR